MVFERGEDFDVAIVACHYHPVFLSFASDTETERIVDLSTVEAHNDLGVDPCAVGRHEAECPVFGQFRLGLNATLDRFYLVRRLKRSLTVFCVKVEVLDFFLHQVHKSFGFFCQLLSLDRGVCCYCALARVEEIYAAVIVHTKKVLDILLFV